MMNNQLNTMDSDQPDKARRTILRWILSIPGILSTVACTSTKNAGDADNAGDQLHNNEHVSVPHRSFIELEFTTKSISGNPFTDNFLSLSLVSPSNSIVSFDGFFDGENRYKARAYCAEIGIWHWETSSNIASINAQTGSYSVVPSELPGKLRLHSDNQRQFMTDDGNWFLHIGDTAYRYFSPTEPHWQEYLDQANQVGFNKVRMWFCQNRYDIQVLFSEDRKELNMAYWQHIDMRLKYAFEHYPNIQLQIIPFAEDTDELRRYGASDAMSLFIGKYFQARYSAFPNVHWCLSNDRVIYRQDEDTSQLPEHKKVRLIPYDTINKLGQDFYKREPWETLITNHQSRFDGYDFYNEDWSSMSLLGDQDETNGDLILKYRELSEQPTILSEDRYEKYAAPQHPRYYFRRMMWSSLLSGGHATYGGLTTSEPFDGYNNGVQGYQRLAEEGRLVGASDFQFITAFFNSTQLDLVEMNPNKDIVGGSASINSCSNGANAIIIYIANPQSQNPGTSDMSGTTPTVLLQLPALDFNLRWYNPRDGSFTQMELLVANTTSVTAPAKGDWVLLLENLSK